MGRKLTREEFIRRAEEVHGKKYDYSKLEYKSGHEKVTIICPIHGEFSQDPFSHLKGVGCKKCADISTSKKRIKSTEKFIEEAIKVHGDKYNYSKVDYKGNKTDVTIICPIHGEFKQKPSMHLRGNGCPKCAKNHKINTEEWIDKARKVHGDKYDYSKTVYVDNQTKVCIRTKDGDEFWQLPSNHLKRSGYRIPITKENFVERAEKVHGKKYDYSKVKFVNGRTDVTIICPIHGEFKQSPTAHLSGRGCYCACYFFKFSINCRFGIVVLHWTQYHLRLTTHRYIISFSLAIAHFYVKILILKLF